MQHHFQHTSPVYGSEIPDGVACVMWSAELCGVGQRNHCRATSSADLTPHKSCMGPARGDGTRQGLEAEPLPGRIPRGAGAAGLTLPSRAFVLQH